MPLASPSLHTSADPSDMPSKHASPSLTTSLPFQPREASFQPREATSPTTFLFFRELNSNSFRARELSSPLSFTSHQFPFEATCNIHKGTSDHSHTAKQTNPTTTCRPRSFLPSDFTRTLAHCLLQLWVISSSTTKIGRAHV